MAWTSPKTWVAGAVVTAAELNTHLRDNLLALKATDDAMQAAWTSYTPTLAQGVSTNIAKTVNYAKYLQIGKLVICQVKLTATAGGTAGSAITITLPATAAFASFYVGSGDYNRGGTDYRALAYLETTTTLVLPHASASGGAIGSTPSIAVTNGDVLWASFQYEAA